MCDKTMPINIRDTIYKTMFKPATIYGFEWWAVKKKHTQKLHTTEMRMLRWATIQAGPRRTTSRTKTSGEKPKSNNDYLPQKETSEMVWRRVLRNVGEDTTKKTCMKEKKGVPTTR